MSIFFSSVALTIHPQAIVFVLVQAGEVFCLRTLLLSFSFDEAFFCVES